MTRHEFYISEGCFITEWWNTAEDPIANTGQGDLVFLAVCTPRFTPDAHEEIESSPVSKGGVHP